VTQVLVLTVMATLVKYTTNESEVRILYEYLAEASIVFPKVFPVIHSLLVRNKLILLMILLFAHP
jgi:neurofibromin 1